MKKLSQRASKRTDTTNSVSPSFWPVGFRCTPQDAIAATEEAEARTSKDAEARWIAVNGTEKIEKSISELQK